MNLRRIRRFWTYVRPFRGQVTLLFVLIAGGILIHLPTPWLEKRIIDDAITNKDIDLLLLLVIAIVSLFVMGRVLIFLRGYASVRIREKVLTSVRLHMYEHLQRMSQAFFARHATGNLLSRVTHDVEQVQNLLNDELFAVIASLIKVVVVIGFLFAISPKLTLLCAVPLPIVGLLFALFRNRVYRQNVSLQERHAELSDQIQQSFSGMKVIQAEVIEERMRDETLKASRALESVGIRRTMLAISGDLMTTLAAYVPILVAIWIVGGKMVIAGTLTLGSLLAFTQYLFGLIGPITQMFRFNMNLQAGYAAADRIFAILDERPEICDAPGARPLTAPIESIELDDVSLTFGGETGEPIHALDRVSFAIRRGERVALVGPSGAGKTSILNLLLRFNQASRGRVLINDEPIERFTIESLRRSLAYVSQEVFLFGGSVRDNVTLGRDVDDDRIRAALAMASATEFVQQLDGGVDAALVERGANLSGGQRQRLAIARMAIKDAQVCLLDEATAALDAQSEHDVLTALREHLATRTALVIAHRFSMLEIVDRVIVLAHGRVVEDGTLQELIDNRGVFHALYQAQHLAPTQEPQ